MTFGSQLIPFGSATLIEPTLTEITFCPAKRELLEHRYPGSSGQDFGAVSGCLRNLFFACWLLDWKPFSKPIWWQGLLGKNDYSGRSKRYEYTLFLEVANGVISYKSYIRIVPDNHLPSIFPVSICSLRSSASQKNDARVLHSLQFLAMYDL